MPQRAKAVVCREINQPVVVEEIEVESPRRGEVMIKLAACGVCHSDYSVTTGTIPFPPPVVLGHEGAGIVIEVGEGVTDFSVGDAVVSSFVSMCGKCRYCQTGRPQLCDQASKAAYTLPDGTVRTKDLQGKPLNIFSGCGVMAEVATLHTDNVVKIAKDIPLDCAALVSCGVMTGVGAVVNTARVAPGSVTVVFGAGGVGLNAIQGCVIAGAAMIVAVDMSDAKLEMARQFGASFEQVAHRLTTLQVHGPVHLRAAPAPHPRIEPESLLKQLADHHASQPSIYPLLNLCMLAQSSAALLLAARRRRRRIALRWGRRWRDSRAGCTRRLTGQEPIPSRREDRSSGFCLR